MAEKMKLLVPDATTGELRETIGDSMEICEAKEPWSEYVLEDGTKIKARQTVVNIVKLNQKNPDGTHVYLLQSQPAMFVIPPIK
jgi:hypothetical protein